MSVPIDSSPQSAFTAGYQTYRNLPPLAGLCSFAKAERPGLSVEQSVRRLKRHHYVLRRIHGILTARITAEPIYELKMAWSHQAWLCAEQVSALRTRVGEMREPPLGLDKVPHEGLALVFDELLSAPATCCCWACTRSSCLRCSVRWPTTGPMPTHWPTNPPCVSCASPSST